MKIKSLAIVAAMSIVLGMCGNAQAFPRHHGPHPLPPAPRRVVIHHGGSDAAWSFFGGMLGAAAAGVYVAANQQNYYPIDEQQCYVVVSKSSGNITKKCVSTGINGAEVLYVD